jgi:hypothetical protein
MTQSPGHGKCAVHPWPGLCGVPLALRLNEGLGITRRAATCAEFASLAYPQVSLYLGPCVLAGLVFRSLGV